MRNDKALLNYFFVQARDPPLLCSIDLPDYGLSGSLSLFTDQELYGPGGTLCTQVQVPLTEDSH